MLGQDRSNEIVKLIRGDGWFTRPHTYFEACRKVGAKCPSLSAKQARCVEYLLRRFGGPDMAIPISFENAIELCRLPECRVDMRVFPDFTPQQEEEIKARVKAGEPLKFAVASVATAEQWDRFVLSRAEQEILQPCIEAKVRAGWKLKDAVRSCSSTDVEWIKWALLGAIIGMMLSMRR